MLAALKITIDACIIGNRFPQGVHYDIICGTVDGQNPALPIIRNIP